MTWLATGVLAVFAFSTDAKADYHPFRNGSRAEIRSDRGELRRDVGEFHRDRADLRRAYRNDAGPGAIASKRAEIRHDLNEIRGDRRELRGDYRAFRRDRWGRPYYDRYANRGWWNPWFRR
jgi:hypothetical protein